VTGDTEGTLYTFAPEQTEIGVAGLDYHHVDESWVQDIGKLNGISGGAVFVLRNDTPRLAGIVIEYHSNTAEIVCTSSAVIWTMVRQVVERHVAS